MTTAPEQARDEGMARAENAADPRRIAWIDDTIADFNRSGLTWSANDLRRYLPDVYGPLLGARIRAAAMRRPREMVKVGMTRSDLPSTHNAWIAMWQGVESC